MEDIPEWIQKKLEPDSKFDLPQSSVVRVFLREQEKPKNEQRPFLTRLQVQSELKKDPVRQTVGNRLKELVEIEILNSETLTNGSIY